MKTADVLICGASHGGSLAAISLRRMGFTGSIALIDKDSNLPYERPPLSKDFLAGLKSKDWLRIRPESSSNEDEIQMLLGEELVGLAPDRRMASVASGKDIACENFVWAVGGRAKSLSCPGASQVDVATIRSMSDVSAILVSLGDRRRRVCIVGGGYVGLEAAASLRKLGHEITVLEAVLRVLSRVSVAAISEFLEEAHRRQGVSLRLNCRISLLNGLSDGSMRVRLVDGGEIDCDMVIAGVGIDPNIEVLTEAGADHVNGVRVHEFCRTSLDHIYAIGDCAEHRNRFACGDWVRVESVQNASDITNTASGHIRGAKVPCTSIPWFWSNQYDIKLQAAGLAVGHDASIDRRGSDPASFSILYLRADRLTAIDCINSVKDFAEARRLIESGAEFDRDLLPDAANPPKQCVQADAR